MTDIVVFGTSELARIMVSMLREDPRYRVVAATAHRQYLDAMPEMSVPVCAYEDLADVADPARVQMIVAIGYTKMNEQRQRVVDIVTADGWQLASFIHEHAWVSTDAQVGEGAIVFPHATIEPFARLGRGVVVWSSATICHDATVGEMSYVAPGATVCGNVRIAERCFVGAGATIRDSVELAPRTLVGAGACVLFSTEPDSVHRGTHAAAIGRSSCEVAEINPHST